MLELEARLTRENASLSSAPAELFQSSQAGAVVSSSPLAEPALVVLPSTPPNSGPSQAGAVASVTPLGSGRLSPSQSGAVVPASPPASSWDLM